MQAITELEFCKKPNKYLDQVCFDHQSLIINRKGKSNAVLISTDVFDEMIENQFVLGNPDNLLWLTESKKQAESKILSQHDLIQR